MAKPGSAVLTSLILLMAGTLVGYQLAMVHLQTEKVAGQVILSQRQFEHMLQSMDQSSWNQPARVTSNWMGGGSHQRGNRTGREMDSEDLGSRKFDRMRYDPTHIPPNVKDFMTSRSCKRLWEKTNNSQWFHEKFVTRTKPLWDWSNLNLSTEVFDWWNNIQPGSESLPEVMELAKTLLPPGGRAKIERCLSLSHTCCRCAVVGNSANILDSKYGEFIDAHNFVLRMNKCPTETFEEDVGRRVTHYIAYPESYYQEYLKNASLLFIPFKAADLLWLRNYLSFAKKPPDKKALDISRVKLYNPELMWNAKHIWGVGWGRYPSTGFLAAIFALYNCDEVNIFGYGPNRLGQWDHYYDDKEGESNSMFQMTLVHDSEAELQLLHHLDTIGKISLYQGIR
ncbi:CMP-N-acetylneuraminate-beta-galactosamide-alpha-2,3-sialyltransferase 1-like isoform X2 [Apostichopus japonicus]